MYREGESCGHRMCFTAEICPFCGRSGGSKIQSAPTVIHETPPRPLDPPKLDADGRVIRRYE